MFATEQTLQNDGRTFVCPEEGLDMRKRVSTEKATPFASKYNFAKAYLEFQRMRRAVELEEALVRPRPAYKLSQHDCTYRNRSEI
jgi:hypothetical protein